MRTNVAPSPEDPVSERQKRLDRARRILEDRGAIGAAACGHAEKRTAPEDRPPPWHQPGLHEWFTEEPAISPLAPLTLWIELARSIPWPSGPESSTAPGHLVWVGRRCWPHPPALIKAIAPPDTETCAAHLLTRSLFLDPANRTQRLWAAEQALRSPAVALVFADGTGLSLTETRRLQLAGSAGGTALLAMRPLKERNRLSAAAVRWAVHPHPSDTPDRQWMLALLRCKGVQPTGESARHWLVRCDHVTGRIQRFPLPTPQPHVAAHPNRQATGPGGVAAVLGDRAQPASGAA